jgi:hypothetical protein
MALCCSGAAPAAATAPESSINNQVQPSATRAILIACLAFCISDQPQALHKTANHRVSAVGGATIPIGLGVVFFDFAVMFGVEFAGFHCVVGRVGCVTGGHVSMMARGLGVAGFMVRGGFAMVLGGLFEMVGGVGVMFVGVMGRRHVGVLWL